MIFFVTVLRALAAMIITNAHYVGVYPTDLIANGGLLGDVIFFCMSSNSCTLSNKSSGMIGSKFPFTIMLFLYS